MTFLALIIFICLLLSAFFSGSEMAFVSSNKMKMRHRADSGNPAASQVVRLYHKSQEFLTTILILNNLVNITATAALTVFFEEYLHIRNEWVVTAFFIPVFLIFGEMIPKDLGRLRPSGYLLFSAWILEGIVKALHWPVRLLMRTVDRLLGRFRSVMHKNIFVSQNELRLLIEESAQSGVLEPHERKMINTILDFEKIQIDSVMIPLEKVSKVDLVTSTVGEIKALARKNAVRMILVYEEIPSIVMGMVYVYDLLFEADDKKPLREYLRAPIFLPTAASIEHAFLTLQQKRQSFAVVIDESSEAVGVVPVERLIDF